MEKLELKHLAPYLPYGLNMYYAGKKGSSIIDGNIEPYTSEMRPVSMMPMLRNEKGLYKPILRPLSDLTKEITTHKICGEFIEQWCEDWIEHFVDFTGKHNEANIKACPYDLMEILLENHYDVFGLIEKGLAIDINTIKS